MDIFSQIKAIFPSWQEKNELHILKYVLALHISLQVNDLTF